VNIEGMPESERRAILDRLEAAHPGTTKLARGRLAGRATPDRPDVPIWEYRTYTANHPEVELDELAVIRFPIIFYGGRESTIESAVEHLAPSAFPPTVPISLDDVIDLWAQLHSAGVVEWDHERRAVEHVRPYEDYKAVLTEWGARLRGSTT
jgi:hypothetical protein